MTSHADKTPVRFFRTAASILVLCSSLHAVLGMAEQADRSKPVNIEADSVQMDDLQKTSVYQGDVVLQQGTLLVRADKLIAHQDAQGYGSGTAFGSPAYFRQKQDNSDEYLEGWADRIDMDNHKNTVLLTGHARLKRGADEMHANSMIYNTVTQQFEAKSEPAANGAPPHRVRTAIFPKAAPPAPQSPLPLNSSSSLSTTPDSHE